MAQKKKERIQARMEGGYEGMGGVEGEVSMLFISLRNNLLKF